MATRDEAISEIQTLIDRVEKVTAGLTPRDLKKTVYEGGWTVKQTLCHMAVGAGGVARTLQRAADTRPPQPPPPGFDVHAYNARQVESRMFRTLKELVQEIRTKREEGIQMLRSAPSDVLNRQLPRPGSGQTMTVPDLIAAMARDHDGGHLRDIEKALGR